MTEAELTAFLKLTYPRENEACEWKQFTRLKNAWGGNKGDDVESYVSAIANMRGGHLVIGVEDATLRVVGIEDFHDYTPENARFRLAGRCAHLNTEKLHIAPYAADDTGKTIWVMPQFRRHGQNSKRGTLQLSGPLISMTGNWTYPVSVDS